MENSDIEKQSILKMLQSSFPVFISTSVNKIVLGYIGPYSVFLLHLQWRNCSEL